MIFFFFFLAMTLTGAETSVGPIVLSFIVMSYPTMEYPHCFTVN